MNKDYDVYEVFDTHTEFLSGKHTYEVAKSVARMLAGDGHKYGAIRYEVRDIKTGETMYEVDCEVMNEYA